MKAAVSGILVFFVVLVGLEFSAGTHLSYNKAQVMERLSEKGAFLSASDRQISQKQEGVLLTTETEYRLYEESRHCSNGKAMIGLSASFFSKAIDLFGKCPKGALLPFTARVPIYLKFHSLRL